MIFISLLKDAYFTRKQLSFRIYTGSYPTLIPKQIVDPSKQVPISTCKEQKNVNTMILLKYIIFTRFKIYGFEDLVSSHPFLEDEYSIWEGTQNLEAKISGFWEKDER